jgi:hypothetical protein
MFKEQFGSHMVENLYVRFFSFVNDNKNVDVKRFQTMKYIFCCNSPPLVCNPKTQERESFVLYNFFKWNNNIEKTWEGRAFYYNKNVWGGNEQSFERRSGETTYQKEIIKSIW